MFYNNYFQTTFFLNIYVKAKKADQLWSAQYFKNLSRQKLIRFFEITICHTTRQKYFIWRVFMLSEL